MSETPNPHYPDAYPLYVERGWPGVLPLPKDQKSPPPRGFTGAGAPDPSEADLARWAQEYPQGNVGLRMPEGAVGLDVDSYGRKTGGASLYELIEKYGPLPPTWTSTARAGQTVSFSGIKYFRVPEGVKLSANPAPGIDVIQRHHRYACVWPSWHPDAEAHYQWYGPDGKLSDSPKVSDLPDLPEAWVEGLRAGADDRAGADEGHHDLRGVGGFAQLTERYVQRVRDGGGCHDTAVALANQLRDNGCSLDDALRVWMLGYFNETRACTEREEYTYSEVQKAAEWAYSQPAREPLPAFETSTDLEPFVPRLPDDFWTARPELEHVRVAARSRLIVPDALLAAVLARVALFTDHRLMLPPMVGSPASLNSIFAVTGNSGAGKGIALKTSKEALPYEPARLGYRARPDSIPLGSGEGMTHTFFADLPKESGAKGTERGRVYDGVMVQVDEGQMFKAMADRSGQITMQMIRQGWSGETLGGSYANKDKQAVLPEFSYRLVVLVGVQPEHAAYILGDAAGGTPQRFYWVQGEFDPEVPDVLPDWPGPLPWTPFVNATGGQLHLHVAQVAVEETQRLRRENLDKAKRAKNRQADLFDGQRNLLRLKMAALLGLLNERANVNDEDWHLAGVMMDTSDAVRKSVIGEIREAAERENRARGAAAAQRQRAVKASTDAVVRVARNVAKKVREGEGAAVTRHAVSAKVANRDRRLLDDALEHALAQGWIDECEGGFQPGDSLPT